MALRLLQRQNLFGMRYRLRSDSDNHREGRRIPGCNEGKWFSLDFSPVKIRSWGKVLRTRPVLFQCSISKEGRHSYPQYCHDLIYGRSSGKIYCHPAWCCCIDYSSRKSSSLLFISNGKTNRTYGNAVCSFDSSLFVNTLLTKVNKRDDDQINNHKNNAVFHKRFFIHSSIPAS